MAEINREVEYAATALASEIMKLSPLEGAERTALCLTIEKALERLAAGIVAQSRNIPEACPAEVIPVELCPSTP